MSLWFLHVSVKALISMALLILWDNSHTKSALASDLDSKKFIPAWEEETGFYQALEVTKESPILSKDSRYQHIEVHESRYYGKILVLDGVVQLTEKDADSYNEMMAHIPMMQHENPRRALVIGGGDGFVLSEVLKHDSLEHVDHVDLDQQVVETCKEHFSWGSAWEDPRVTLHVADGAAFVRDSPDASYDVIVQDSSDPWTSDDKGEHIDLPSLVLYTSEHFHHVHRILKPNGVFNLQSETFQLPSDLDGIVDWRKQALQAGFKRASYGSLYISSYTTGQIGFLLCEKDPSRATSPAQVEERFEGMVQRGRTTTYYHPKLQQSSFDLPLWVEKYLYHSDEDTTAGEKSEQEL